MIEEKKKVPSMNKVLGKDPVPTMEEVLGVKKKDISGLKSPIQPLLSGGGPLEEGLRPDGTKKGSGFLGGLTRPDGGISSELSVSYDIDGKEVLMPTLVPTLEQNEIDYLLKTPADQIFTADEGIYKGIEEKAIGHAQKRIAEGKSPFAGEGESLEVKYQEPDRSQIDVSSGLGYAYGRDIPKGEVSKELPPDIKPTEFVYEKKEAEDSYDYILNTGLNESLIGLAYKASSGRNISTVDLSRYEPNTYEKIGAGLTSLILDLPSFAPGGAIGGGIAKLGFGGFVSITSKFAVRDMVKRGATKEVARATIAEASRVAMELSPTRILVGAGQSGGALAFYESGRDVLSQVANENKDLGDIDYGQTLRSFKRGAALGTAVGMIGVSGSLLSRAVQSRIGGVAGKVAGYGVETGAFGAENAAFIYGGALLDQRPLGEVTGEDWVITLGTLAGLRGVNKIRGLIKSPNFKKENTNKEEFRVELSQDEIDRINKSLSKKVGTSEEVVESVKENPDIVPENTPILTKLKLAWATEGVRPKIIPEITNITTFSNKEGNFLLAKDKDGTVLLENKYDSKEEMKADETRYIWALKEKAERQNAEKLTADERIKTIENFKAGGDDFNELNKALERLPWDRTADETKIVQKFNNEINNILGAREPEKPSKPIEVKPKPKEEPKDVTKEVETKESKEKAKKETSVLEKEPPKPPVEERKPEWKQKVTPEERKVRAQGVSVNKILSIEDAMKLRDKGKYEGKSLFWTEIKQGKMTAEEAKEVIESAGFEVPKGIMDLLTKPKPPVGEEVTPTEVKKKAVAAKVPDVPVKEQKKDLLGQIDSAIDLVLGEKKVEFEKLKEAGTTSTLDNYINESKINELKKAGFKVEKDGEHITFEIEGDGVFKLSINNLPDSRDIVQKNYPVSEKMPPSKVKMLRGESIRGPRKDFSQEEKILIDNYWEAVRVGDKKTAEMFRKKLVDQGVQIPPSPQKEAETIQSLQEKLYKKEITQKEFNEKAEDIRKEMRESGVDKVVKGDNKLIKSNNEVIELSVLPLPAKEKIRRFAKKYFTSQGLLPSVIFESKIRSKSKIKAELERMKDDVRDLRRAAKKTYGKIDDVVKKEIDDALHDTKLIPSLPESIQEPLTKLRTKIDFLTKKLLDSGLIDGELVTKMANNLGMYVTRTYRVHDNAKKWAKNIPEDVVNKARNFIEKEYKDAGYNITKEELDGEINSLLKDAGMDHLDMMAKRTGSMRFDILKRRRDIPREIRDLLGEWQDPFINATKTITKMTTLLENYKFLNEIAEQNKGKYFFDKKTGENFVEIGTSESMGPLKGIFTTPDIKNALAETTKTVPSWVSTWMKINGAAKYAKTILSPITHIRNFTANFLLQVANGRFRLNKLTDATKRMYDEFGKGDKTKLRELTELGVIHDNARAGELADVIKDAMGHTGDVEQFYESRLKKIAKKTGSVVERVYQAEDDFHKVYAYENELSDLKKAYKGTNKYTEDELKERAAKKVRDTMPTYSMVPETIKKIRRLPLVGSFVSFPAEIFRNTFNIIGTGLKELKIPEERSIGMKRLIGMAAALSIPAAITSYFRYKNNIQSDEDDMLSQFIPEWSANSQIVILSKDVENGIIKYIDLSYSDPYNYIKKPLIAAFREEDPQKAMWESLKEFSTPFLGEEIMTTRMVDIMRNKKKANEREVYNPQAELGDQYIDAMYYLWEGVEPGVISQVKRFFDKNKDFRTEAMAMGTGLRMTTINIPRSIRYKSSQYSKDISNAKGIFYKSANPNRSSPSDIISGFEKAQNSYRRIFNKFSGIVQSALKLGVNPESIYNSLIEGGIGKKEAINIINGTFQQFTPSKEKQVVIINAQTSLAK